MFWTRRLCQAARTSRIPGADVLYVDKGVIVLNKHPGLVCQLQRPDDGRIEPQGAGKSFNSTLEGIRRRFALTNEPLPVHRLDKLTTGALLLARTSSLSRELSRQIQDRTIEKSYLALVRAGAQTFKGEKGRIEKPIQYKDGRASIAKRGEPSITEWEHIATSKTCPLSLVRFNLITGHKHQLRVHAAHVLEAPILGDSLYSETATKNPITRALKVPTERLFLHASSLSLSRYRSNGPHKRLRLTIRAPLPEDFVDVCSQAGLTLLPQDVKGGVFVDGEPLDSGSLPDLNGQWMPLQMA